MSLDPLEQIRALARYYDELAPPVTADELLRTPAGSGRRKSTTVGRVITAAASLALLGGAAWVFVHTTGAGSPSVASATTIPSTATPTSVSVSAPDATWFTLQLEGYRPGAMYSVECCLAFPPPGPPTVAAWGVTSNGAPGFLLLRRLPVTANEQSVETDSLFLPQADGSAWMFDGIGLSQSARATLAGNVASDGAGDFVLKSGGGPVRPLALGELNAGQLRSQVYSSPVGTVTLTVGTYRGEFSRFVRSGPLRNVTVAGLPGYAATTDSSSGFILWQMGHDLWGTLEAPGATPEQMDALVAGLKPSAEPTTSETPLLHPAIPGQLRGQAMVIQRRGSVPMLAWTLEDSLPPSGGDIPLAGWNWDDVDGEQTFGDVTWGGMYEVIGTWDGTTLTVTQPPVQAVYPTRQPFAFVTTDCEVNSFAPERQDLEHAGRVIDHLLTVNINQTNGHCGLTIDATVASPALTDLLTAHAAHIDSVTYRLTPA